MKTRIEDWLWEHHGDAFDRHLQWRHRARRWLLYVRCFWIGHKVAYSAPDYWNYEGSFYCERCNGHDDTTSPFWERWTLPEMIQQRIALGFPRRDDDDLVQLEKRNG